MRRHEGSYDLYRRLKEEREAAERAAVRSAAPARPAAKPERPAGGPRKLSWQERKELEGIEGAILEAEEEKERLGAALSDPALYADTPEKVAEVSAAFQRAGERVDALFARWAELEERGG